MESTKFDIGACIQRRYVHANANQSGTQCMDWHFIENLSLEAAVNL